MKVIDIDFTVSKALAKREILKYIRNRTRLITSLFQSIIFLVIFGIGIGNIGLVSAGMIPQAILFTGVFAGISIVTDRMFGFHKEIMIAPISRTTITFGKAVGGTIIACLQGLILLIIASAFGIFGYPFLPLRILAALPVILLIGFMVVSLGNLIASKMKDFHQMQFLMTFVVMPMFMTSGALINFVGTPFYLFTLINPMTYAVDAMRWVMLFNPLNVDWRIFGQPFFIDIIVMVCFSMVFMLLAAYIFRKSEAV